MRILLITPFPLISSQSGSYTKDIARYFSTMGNEVMVLCIDNKQTVYEEPYRIKTILFNHDENDFMFPCFTTHPHTEMTFQLLNNSNLDKYISILKKEISSVISSFGPDIIHSQYLWINTALTSSVSGKIPLITTSFGNENSLAFEDGRYSEFVSTAVEKSRFIIAPSKNIEMQLRSENRLDGVKLKLIYRGYDDDLYKFIDENFEMYREYFGVSEQSKYIVLYADQLNYMKGIDMFLKSAEIIIKKRKDICFAVVGSGDFSGKVEELSKENRYNYLYLSAITEEEKPSLLHLSNVTVIPSRFEQFGINALQSLAMGTPVVSSSAGELPHFINSENGKVIKEMNESDFADAICGFIDSDFKTKVSFFCHQFASRNYSKTSGLNLLNKLYEHAIKE